MKSSQYDVALSFAGEDRQYVEEVASELRRLGFDVFYDKYETADLWGKNLYIHLREVYYKRARFTVMFISCHYREKLWTNHERESAQARAFTEGSEYILPARFDDTEIPGLLPTIAYVDLKRFSPVEFASLLAQKIGPAKCLKPIPSAKLRWGIKTGWQLMRYRLLIPNQTPEIVREVEKILRDIIYVLQQDGVAIDVEADDLFEQIAGIYRLMDLEKHCALILGFAIMTLNLAVNVERFSENDSKLKPKLLQSAYDVLGDIDTSILVKKDALFRALTAAAPIDYVDAATVVERHFVL